MVGSGQPATELSAADARPVEFASAPDGDETLAHGSDSGVSSRTGGDSPTLERLQRLQQMTACLNSAGSLAQVADIVLNESMSVLGAAAGSLSLLARDRSEFYVLQLSGFSAAIQDSWRTFPADAVTPVAEAVRSRQVVEFANVRERGVRYPGLAHPLPSGDLGACMAAPMFLKDGLVATLELFFPEERTIIDEDRTMVRTVADLSAQALDRARLYDAARGEAADRERIYAALAESEERFRCLVDGAKEHAIFMLTPNNRVASWNVGATRVLGYADHEIVGRSGGMIFAPDDQAIGVPEEELDTALRTGRAEGAGWYVRKDGVSLWCESTVLPIYYPDGRLRGFEKIMQDITERQRQEEELRHHLSLTEAITSNAAEALFLTDDQNRVTYVNPAAERTFGWDRDELLGCVLTEVLRCPGPNGWRDADAWCPFTDALRSGMSIQDHEDVFVRKNGSSIPVNCSYVPIVTKGAITGSVMAVRDITDRKRSEEALREAAYRERRVLRDVLACVTEGKLRLCDGLDDLPSLEAPIGGPILLTATGGIREMRKRAEEVAAAQGLSEQRRVDLEIAIGETAMNAVVHGGGGEGRVYSGPEGSVYAVLEDHGRGITMENLPRATLERGFSTANSLGHGFLLMLESVDYVWLLTNPNGTIVVLRQDHAPPEPAWLRDSCL
jgi:PAS domain S-box-containing protein